MPPYRRRTCKWAVGLQEWLTNAICMLVLPAQASLCHDTACLCFNFVPKIAYYCRKLVKMTKMSHFGRKVEAQTSRIITQRRSGWQSKHTNWVCTPFLQPCGPLTCRSWIEWHRAVWRLSNRRWRQRPKLAKNVPKMCRSRRKWIKLVKSCRKMV